MTGQEARHPLLALLIYGGNVMKRYRDCSFRTKLLFSHISIVVLIVLSITVAVTLTASDSVAGINNASLNLITEQLLINFEDTANNVEQHLFNMLTSTDTVTLMNNLRNYDEESNVNRLVTYDLINSISNMIDTQAPYDNVLVRLPNGTYFSDVNSKADVILRAKAVLESDEIREGNGEFIWVRADNGDLFFARYVYSIMPMRHVGDIAVRVRQERLAQLGSYNDSLNCTILIYGRDNRFIASIGAEKPELQETAAAVLAENTGLLKYGTDSYTTAVYSTEHWTAVGLMPTTVTINLQYVLIRTALFVALLGLLAGIGIAVTMSHQLSRQVRTLVESMDKTAGGVLDLVIPVESHDEIGQLTEHFNHTTRQIRELMERVVREETSKQAAEYQILEYRYRFLQWQINPHFIYNTLETVNAMAKVNGNENVCDMIRSISAYFRTNANSMRKRFIPVQQEFAGLELYATIYRKIYGDTLTTEFICAEEVCNALIPTMIIQPLLENALVHGGRGSHQETRIVVSAQKDTDSTLLIEISDNGQGMSRELIERILGDEALQAEQDGKRTESIGMRNVLDRLHLIYSDAAIMRIHSEEGEGTTVSLHMPFFVKESHLLQLAAEGRSEL
jgi:two-component system, sensor histidine kinase YesM